MIRWLLRRIYCRCGWVLPVAVVVACIGLAVTLTEREEFRGPSGQLVATPAAIRKDAAASRSVSVAYQVARGGFPSRRAHQAARVSARAATYPVNWRRRYQREHRHVQRLLRQLERARSVQAHETPQAIIRRVFGTHGAEAVRVAYCETGGTYSPTARNGEHLGVFQMGAWERRTYGDAWDVEGQARAAYRYFAAAGMTWGPWECKP